MTKVYDGQRILEFEGNLISSSSSYREDAARWIDFHLYLTSGGQYVVSRVGCSLVYHLSDCHISISNRLQEVSRGELSGDDEPCPECNPHLSSLPLVCFESERHRAEVCENQMEVVSFLTKKDPRTKKVYLTRVARSLLDQAFTDFEWTEKVK